MWINVEGILQENLGPLKNSKEFGSKECLVLGFGSSFGWVIPCKIKPCKNNSPLQRSFQVKRYVCLNKGEPSSKAQ